MSAVLEAHEPSAQYLVAEQPALVRQFVLLATAPGGVPRLRDLILTLAVQGKLVEQSERDEPVAVVLREIQLAKGGAVPRRRSRATDTDDALIAPFALPDTWDWVRLGEVTDISGGVTLGRKGSIEQPLTLPYLRVANVQRWNVLCDDLKTITIGRAELARYQLCAGDLLITEGGDWDKVGRTAIWREELPVCLHQNHVFKARGLTPRWNPEWAQLYLNSPIARAYFASCSKQTTNLASINMTQLKACTFPLPPVAEQARIVARVNELMGLCDALEAKGRLEAEQHARLLGTLLGTLTGSSTPDDLAANWQRVADHFDLLLDRPEAVDALEQTILQLAVRGLLVPQDPSDEPASLLVHALETARGELNAVGSRKTSKPTPAIFAEEALFDLPNGWFWERIDRLATVQGGIQKTPLRRPVRNHAPYLRVANVQRDALDLQQIEHFEVSADELERWRLHAGDLLIVEGNGSEHEIGRCAVWTGSIEPCVYQNHLIRVRCLDTTLVAFIQLFLNSPDGKAEMKRLAITTSGLFNLSVGKIRHYAVPVPPLSEQARIVARVTELRRLCADLRKRLTASQTTQSHLAEAFVNMAVA